MKTKLLYIFLLLNTTFVLAQLTPQWEEFNSGLNYIQDSTSDKDNYIFNSPHLSGYFSLSSWLDSDSGIEPLNQLDSNSYARIVYEVKIKFPKSGEYFSENDNNNIYLLNLYNHFVHIEISTDGLKTWQRIYSFQANSEGPFNEIPIDTLGGFRLQFVNDSTIILFGSIKESIPTTQYMTSGFIATLKKSKSGSQWNFTENQFWRRTNSFLTQMIMLDEKIGYAVLIWNFLNGRTAIVYTNDGWNTFKEIFSSKMDPNLKFGGAWYRNLNVSTDKNDTLISFFESDEQLIYYSRDDFRTFYNIDFNNYNHILQIYSSDPRTIYALFGKYSEDANNSKFLGNVLQKTTNFGNTWVEICKSNKSDQILNFNMFDENNFIFKGYFHPQNDQSRCSFWGTTDGGKTFQYIFEPNIKIDGRYPNYYDDDVSKYLYKNKDQIICLMNRNKLEQPFHDTNLSFFNHIKEIFSKGYTRKYDYFCSTKKIEIPPPFIKFDDSLISKHNTGTDTLYWNKIPSADSYNISYYGIADASFHYILESSGSNPLNFSTLTTERIDTTVKDTFLIMNGLKRNYKYEIRATAQNNAQKSIETLLISLGKDSLFILEKPKIEFPKEKDTVQTGEISFKWKSVPNADSYNITLFDTKSKTLFSSFSIKMRFLVNARNVQDTFYVFKGLEADRGYVLTITAQNDEEVTNCSVTHFYASNNVAVSNEYIDEAQLYPNPTTDHIFVRNTYASSLQEIEIFNIFGKRVFSVETQNFVSLQKIDVSFLPAGIYFLKLNNQKPVKFIKL